MAAPFRIEVEKAYEGPLTVVPDVNLSLGVGSTATLRVYSGATLVFSHNAVLAAGSFTFSLDAADNAAPMTYGAELSIVDGAVTYTWHGTYWIVGLKLTGPTIYPDAFTGLEARVSALEVGTGLPDATAGAKGAIQLAGDLGGTAASPTVTGPTHMSGALPATVDAGLAVVTATGAATARALRDRAADIVNVKDFGAKGDGTTDDTAAIQAAITTAHAAGGHIVFIPGGQYRITGTLTVYQYVKIVGVGSDRYNSSGTYGTKFLHRPAATADFMIVKRDPAGPYPSGYGEVALEGFTVDGDATNSRDGIYVQTAKVLARDLVVDHFTGKAMRFSGAIHSVIEAVLVRNSDYGFFFDPDPALLSTTVAFRSTYSRANRVGARIDNAQGVTFTDTCIFETITESAVEIYDARDIAFVAPYFENITRSFIRAGEGADFDHYVTNLQVIGGSFSGGANNQKWWDAFFMGYVWELQFNPGAIRVEKASVLRSANSTGRIVWTTPAHSQDLYGGLPARANSTAYIAGDKFTAVCDDGATRRFIVTVSGTTAGAKPGGYGANTYNLTDGTASVSRYWDDCVWNQALTLHLGGYPSNLYAKIEAGWMYLLAPTSGSPPVTLVPYNGVDGHINFAGSGLVADVAHSATSWKTGATLQGYVKVMVAGTDGYWIPIYSAPTGP